MNEELDGIRVLVVEDEFLLAEELRLLLQRQGCTVVGPVAKLGAGLSLARDAAIDAAVLDVRLAHADSGPIAEVLSERGCPFLFATGYGETDVPQGEWDAPVLTKPVSHEELLLHLRRMVRGPLPVE